MAYWEEAINTGGILKANNGWGKMYQLMEQGKIPLLVVITVAFMAAMVFYLVKFKPKSKFAVACVIMVIGGGIGNLIDRVMLGYVIDYIILWPFKFIFNFADICVVVGAILVMIYYVFFDRENVEKHE